MRVPWLSSQTSPTVSPADSRSLCGWTRAWRPAWHLLPVVLVLLGCARPRRVTGGLFSVMTQGPPRCMFWGTRRSAPRGPGVHAVAGCVGEELGPRRGDAELRAVLLTSSGSRGPPHPAPSSALGRPGPSGPSDAQQCLPPAPGEELSAPASERCPRRREVGAGVGDTRARWSCTSRAPGKEGVTNRAVEEAVGADAMPLGCIRRCGDSREGADGRMEV